MAERTDTHLEGTASVTQDAPTLAMVKAWFGREILPLEASLMQYLAHNWRNASDINDIRQEIYVRIYEAALQGFPERPRQYLFATARNLLVRRVQHERVVPIEAVADLEALNMVSDEPGPDRAAPQAAITLPTSPLAIKRATRRPMRSKPTPPARGL